MKVILKRALALCLACLLIAGLCGCSALDEMRQNQATMLENGDISWNDTIYKPLPKNPLFSPLRNDTFDVYATKPDVPVLLSNMAYESVLFADSDAVLLEDITQGIWFCRQDHYAEYAAKMNEPFTPTSICFEHGYYDQDSDSYVSSLQLLSQEQAATIRWLLYTVEPLVLDEGFSLNREWSIDLQEASEDLMMRQHLAELFFSGTQYYLCLYKDGVSTLYQIPEESAKLFAPLQDILWK